MEPEYLHCPFCTEGVVTFVYEAPHWWAVCVFCGARGPKATTQQLAHQGWNCRPVLITI